MGGVPWEGPLSCGSSTETGLLGGHNVGLAPHALLYAREGRARRPWAALTLFRESGGWLMVCDGARAEGLPIAPRSLDSRGLRACVHVTQASITAATQRLAKYRKKHRLAGVWTELGVS